MIIREPGTLARAAGTGLVFLALLVPFAAITYAAGTAARAACRMVRR